MADTVTVACIQNCAGPETTPNLIECADLVRASAAAGAGLICLPEYFTGLDVRDGILMAESFAERDHPALPLFADLAREHRAWLLLGSLAIDTGDGQISNRAYVIDPNGEIAARYDKVHLFDVDLANGESYRESATIAPGATAVVADLPQLRLGLSICYDLRFAQLYRALAQGRGRGLGGAVRLHKNNRPCPLACAGARPRDRNRLLRGGALPMRRACWWQRNLRSLADCRSVGAGTRRSRRRNRLHYRDVGSRRGPHAHGR